MFSQQSNKKQKTSSSRNNDSSRSSSSDTSDIGSRKQMSTAKRSTTSEGSSISSWISGQPMKCVIAVERELSSTSYAACPICNTSICVRMMNVHLDSCLGNDLERNKQCPLHSADVTVSSLDGVLPKSSLTAVEHKELPGLWLIYDFINEEEEELIVTNLEMDQTAWHLSTFNGHCLSKTYGVKTQFGPVHVEERIVRANDPQKGEKDIPEYLHPYVDRLKTFLKQSSKKFRMPSVLNSFKPNECNANCYLKSENHSLTAHYDDRFLSGPILMNLSLYGGSRMTYSKGNSEAVHDLVKVELPRRCLQLVTGDARYKYKHRINAEDVLDEKRMSVTWRQAGDSNGGLIRGQSRSSTSSCIDSFLINSGDSS